MPNSTPVAADDLQILSVNTTIKPSSLLPPGTVRPSMPAMGQAGAPIAPAEDVFKGSVQGDPALRSVTIYVQNIQNPLVPYFSPQKLAEQMALSFPQGQGPSITVINQPNRDPPPTEIGYQGDDEYIHLITYLDSGTGYLAQTSPKDQFGWFWLNKHACIPKTTLIPAEVKSHLSQVSGDYASVIAKIYVHEVFWRGLLGRSDVPSADPNTLPAREHTGKSPVIITASELKLIRDKLKVEE